MEFPNLGAHCEVPSCKQLDFLPFQCNACNGSFCLEHRSYRDHACASTSSKIISCPLCHTKLTIGTTMESHLEKECNFVHSKSSVSENTKNNRTKTSQSHEFPCEMKGCHGFELVEIRCPKCRRRFCLKHRFELDHKCPGRRSTVSSWRNNNGNPKGHSTKVISSKSNMKDNRDDHAKPQLSSKASSSTYPNVVHDQTNGNHHASNNNHGKTRESELNGNYREGRGNMVATTTILVRLTDGKTIRCQFAANDSLQNVKQFIDQHRTDGNAPYEMRSTFPTRSFTNADLTCTLEHLNLIPSGTIVLTGPPAERTNSTRESHGTNGIMGNISHFFGRLFH